jgi:hypothetical protein
MIDGSHWVKLGIANNKIYLDGVEMDITPQPSINTMAYDPILESWVIMSSMHPNEIDDDPEEDTPIFVEEDK